MFWSKPGGRAKKGRKKKRRGEEQRDGWGGRTRQLCEFDLICQAFLSGKSILYDKHGWTEAICGGLKNSQDVFLKSLDKERKAGFFFSVTWTWTRCSAVEKSWKSWKKVEEHKSIHRITTATNDIFGLSTDLLIFVLWNRLVTIILLSSNHVSFKNPSETHITEYLWSNFFSLHQIGNMNAFIKLQFSPYYWLLVQPVNLL